VERYRRRAAALRRETGLLHMSGNCRSVPTAHLNVDVQAVNWGNVLGRRTKKYPFEKASRENFLAPAVKSHT
jgi:hypothetical protein